MIAALVRASLNGVVGVAVAWLICRMVPKLSPSVRGWLWWAAAMKFLIALVWTAPIPLSTAGANPGVATNAWSGPVAPRPSAPAASTGAVAVGPAFARNQLTLRPSAEPGEADPVWRQTQISGPLRWPQLMRRFLFRASTLSPAPYLRTWPVALWAAGAVAAFALMLRGWRRGRAILKASVDAPPDVVTLVGELVSRLLLRRAPVVRLSDEIATPLVIGLLRPVLALPGVAFAGLSTDARRMAICHELAHVKRQDVRFGLVPALAEALFFFHPSAKSAAREYAIAREAACDALVIQTLDVEPADYARLLVDLGVSQPRLGLSAAGASWSTTILKRRLVLLGSPVQPTPASRVAAGFALAVALAVVPMRPATRAFAMSAPPSTGPLRAAVDRTPSLPPKTAAIAPHATIQASPTTPAPVAPERDAIRLTTVGSTTTVLAAPAEGAPTQSSPQTAPGDLLLKGLDDIHAVWVLLFDDSTLTDDSRSRAVEAGSRWLTERQTSDSLVSILTLDSQLTMQSDFTTDRSRLLDALADLRRGHASPAAGANVSMLRALRVICDKLRTIQRPKHVLVFTEGATDKASTSFTTDLRAMNEACTTANVTVEPVDARGLVALRASPDNQAISAPADPRFAETDLVLVDVSVTDTAGQPVNDVRLPEFQVFEDGAQQTITFMSETFGARSFLPGSQTTSAAPYYVLGYRATNKSLATSYRSIRVDVSRPGVQVTARKGYYGGEDMEGAYPEDTPGLVPPVVRERRDATYTADAFRAKIQGNVIVEAVVGVDGHVTRARVAQSLDPVNGLDDQALSAVRQWTFAPGELNGDKVPVWVRLILLFRLH